jgi:hypothetical protein
MANLDIAEDFRAGADHDPVSHLRMPVATFFACAAERHILKN